MKVYVADTPNTGKGIFARKKIKRGETIFIAKGKLVHFLVKSSKDSQYGERWLGMGLNLWLDPKNTNPWHFINHSCNPNAGIKGTVTVKALKDIKKDEEVTVDYSTTETDKLWSMNCSCGNKNCRHVIKAAQFVKPGVIKKYMPFVPNYTQKVLSKSS